MPWKKKGEAEERINEDGGIETRETRLDAAARAVPGKMEGSDATGGAGKCGQRDKVRTSCYDQMMTRSSRGAIPCPI